MIAARFRRWPPAWPLLPYLLASMLVAATVVGLAVRPPAPATEPNASHAIIAGAAGLRWDDLDPERTPHLWRLAEEGAIGSLAARSANRLTCPGDGWLTLGAGNWAADTTRPADAPCVPLRVTIEPTGAAGAYLPQQEAVVRANRWDLPWGAVPGALAGAVECTTAVGAGGAVAGARVYGRVDRYEPRVPADRVAFQELLERCELAIIDLGTVSGEGSARRTAAERVDAALAAVQDARPPASLLLVTGVSDTGPPPRLHVVIGQGPGLDGGLLTSSTTRRTGYLQLVDLAPTALAAVGRSSPEVRMAGHPAYPVPVGTGVLAHDIRRMVAADDEAGRAQPVRGGFLIGVVVAQLLLFAAVVPLLRPPRPRPAGPGLSGPAPTGPAGDGANPDRDRPEGTRPARSPPRAVAPVLLVGASLALPAALATGGVPWWRAEPSEVVFLVSWLAMMAVATTVLVRSALYHRTLAVVGVTAAVAAAAVAADLLSGARLQLNSVVGYSAQDGDRFAGVGPLGAGLLIAGTLLASGCLAQQVHRRWRALVVATPGSAAVVLLGSSYLGGEIGAAVAMTVGVCMAAALCTGGWLTVRRLGWAGVAGLGAIAAVAVVDVRRPVEQRGGLGRLFTELADGTAGFGLQRVSLTNWEALSSSPVNVLAVGGGLLLWLVLLRPSGGLRRLFGLYPALRAAMAGTVTASVLAGVLTGQALIVAGAAAAVALPLVTLAALRTREERAGVEAAASTESRATVLW